MRVVCLMRSAASVAARAETGGGLLTRGGRPMSWQPTPRLASLPGHQRARSVSPRSNRSWRAGDVEAKTIDAGIDPDVLSHAVARQQR